MDIQSLYNSVRKLIIRTNVLYVWPRVVDKKPKWENYSWMNEPVTKYAEDCRRYEDYIKTINEIKNV